VRRTSSSCQGSCLVTQHRAFLYPPIWRRTARLQSRECKKGFESRKTTPPHRGGHLCISGSCLLRRRRAVALIVHLVTASWASSSSSSSSSSTADSVAPSQSRRRSLTRRPFKGIVTCSYIVGWLRNLENRHATSTDLALRSGRPEGLSSAHRRYTCSRLGLDTRSLPPWS